MPCKIYYVVANRLSTLPCSGQYFQQTTIHPPSLTQPLYTHTTHEVGSAISRPIQKARLTNCTLLALNMRPMPQELDVYFGFKPQETESGKAHQPFTDLPHLLTLFSIAGLL